MAKHQNIRDQKGLKRTVIFTFLFMLIGTVLELYLLGHYEDRLQLIPIFCISAAMLSILLFLFFKKPLILRLFKLALGLCAFSGFYGAFLHFEANLEFEKELAPTAGKWDWFVESWSGAIPILAPFSMVVLALIGYTYLLIIKNKS